MKTPLAFAAATVLVAAIGCQPARAQNTQPDQVLAPPSSAQILSDTIGAQNPYPYQPPPPPVAYGYPPPPPAPPPAVGYGSSLPPGYRPTQPQNLNFGNAQPSEENYR